MDIKIYALASGSKGNAFYISDGTTNILIDCGLPVKELQKRASACGVDLLALTGILSTHCHSDHCCGISSLCEWSGAPVYLDEGGVEALQKLCSLNRALMHPFRRGEDFSVGTVAVHPLSLSHDVPVCTGYVLSIGDKKVVYVADLGFVDDHALRAVNGAYALILESNHDIDMLMRGTYPRFLKERIRSPQGHLSNDQAAELALYAVQNGTRNLMLAHLSEENNLPELAFHTVERRLLAEGYIEGRDYSMVTAGQGAPTRLPLDFFLNK
ncbi:MAG: MBL fold metallo-hydrolase [Clostridia bacterium]|nr:MBL fold metallo-hydrolase [Clostridia bacterium]